MNPFSWIKNLFLLAVSLAPLVTAFTTDKGAVLSPDGATRTEQISTFKQLRPSAKAEVQERYGRLPLHFEPNRGQADLQVKFLARGVGYTLFLTSAEAVLVLGKPNEKAEDSRETTSSRCLSIGDPESPNANPESPNANPQATVLRIKLVGANPNPPIVALDELPGKVAYLVARDPSKWRTQIPTFAKIEYKDVYRGVDLVYYGNQRQLEYDFIIAPGADPKKITLAFEGAAKIRVDDQGDLVIHTAGGEIRQPKPLIYQEVDSVRQEIPGGYVLKGAAQVGFLLGAYDPFRPLIIDPVLAYSTYLGGGSNDFASGIAVDASGNAYLTGETSSTDFPTANPIQPTFAGGLSDAYVTKVNADGSAFVYSTYLGGSNRDRANSIAADASGTAYVTGFTESLNFPTANPFQSFFGGGFSDAFVARLSADGSILEYSTYLGGSSLDTGVDIVVDAPGSVYVTGVTSSTNFPTASPLQATLRGPADAFVTKVSPAGSTLIYSTYLGGSGIENGTGIAVDAADNAYLTGETQSEDFPTAKPLQPTSGGDWDAFVAKLTEDGSGLAYATYLGGSDEDRGQEITVDTSGKAYVAGYTASTSFPTASPLQPAFGGGSFDAFVASVSADGSELLYSTYLGGSSFDVAHGMVVDAEGNAYVAGSTSSSDFPTENPLQPAFGGGPGDAFIAKLTADGSALVYSTYLGGSGFDEAQGIAVDSSGNAFVTGSTGSTDFPTANPLQPTLGGGFSDAFVARVDTSADLLVRIAVDVPGEHDARDGDARLVRPAERPTQPASGSRLGPVR